jgi:hypothetical protein
MATKLDTALKREITIRDEPFMLTLTADGVTITPKGHRKGKTFTWWELWAGEAELAAQLRASVEGLRRDGHA